MGNPQGSDRHGPGGDPSWLGGGDRGARGAEGGEGWSSEFGSGAPAGGSNGADADFSQARSRDMPSDEGPQFGEVTGDQRTPQDRGDRGNWAPTFGDEGADEHRPAAATRPQLLKLATLLIPLLIIAVVAYLNDVTFWWVLLPIVYPIVRRGIRLVTQSLRR